MACRLSFCLKAEGVIEMGIITGRPATTTSQRLYIYFVHNLDAPRRDPDGERYEKNAN